ncbi:protein ripply3 [Mixophyes fleayi]|uniref:protein ripply3 n=1 Tax=Mixophyes fleayi TaxID=3061075 RepID=UPI003F4DDB38
MDSAHYTLKTTVSHMCHCSRAMASGPAESNLTLWRPWVSSFGSGESRTQESLKGTSDGDNCVTNTKGALGFQHPVRLYMPKSKKEEYLQHMGRTVLASFPVQATIDFYNDDSESEEEEEDNEMDYCNYYRHYESFPGQEVGGTMEDNSTYSSATKQYSQ